MWRSLNRKTKRIIIIFTINICIIFSLFYFTVPPDRLSVLNEKGDHIPHYILGPYKEGVTVDITCIASGGNVKRYAFVTGMIREN